MKKIFVLAIVLFLMSTSFACAINYIESYNLGVNVNGNPKPLFGQALTTTIDPLVDSTGNAILDTTNNNQPFLQSATTMSATFNFDLGASGGAANLYQNTINYDVIYDTDGITPIGSEYASTTQSVNPLATIDNPTTDATGFSLGVNEYIKTAFLSVTIGDGDRPGENVVLGIAGAFQSFWTDFQADPGLTTNSFYYDFFGDYSLLNGGDLSLLVNDSLANITNANGKVISWLRPAGANDFKIYDVTLGVEVAPVPEPSTLLLLGSGLLGLGWYGRKRKKS